MLDLFGLRVDFDFIGLQHLKDVVVVGLQLGVLERKIMGFRIFVLYLGFKVHVLCKKLVFPSLCC